MSTTNESASLKDPNRGDEQISKPDSSKKLCVQQIPVTFTHDIMLEFLKFLSWKTVNKCQRVDSKWFQLIKREKAKEKSTLPPQLIEHFEISSASYQGGYHYVTEQLRGIKESQNQEMQCFANCTLTKNVTTGLVKKLRTFTGNKQDRRIIQLKIDVGIKGAQKDDERIFSWKFDNKIRNYFWAHLEHWFKHLREPFGPNIKSVTLVPFDLTIWETMEKDNPNLLKKVYAETLTINCVLVKGNEFEWVLNFSEKYCSASTLIWNIEKNGVDGVDMDDEHVRLNDILKFVQTQRHNFAALTINSWLKLDIDSFASHFVEMFKGHENPSKLIDEFLFKCEGDFDYMVDNVARTFPFCTESDDREYKNRNSDFILKMTQEFDYDRRTICFTVIHPKAS